MKKYAYLIAFDYDEVFGKPQFVVLNDKKKAIKKLEELAKKEYEKEENRNRYKNFKEYLSYNFWDITKIEYK